MRCAGDPAPPKVSLNGQPARPAPGLRLRGDGNLLQPASVAGQNRVVHDPVDRFGQLMDAGWLDRTELANKAWPTTAADVHAWAFDPATQTWST